MVHIQSWSRQNNSSHQVSDKFVSVGRPVLIWLITDSHSTSILHERVVLWQVEGRLRSAMLFGNAHYQRLIATLRYHIIEWCYCFLSFFSFIISVEQRKKEREREKSKIKLKVQQEKRQHFCVLKEWAFMSWIASP